ncbi:GLPGLI family protein [Aquimarina sp. MMG016]|uniref:GLPGLI family protein n=1 Tax=Aquimarina sp. MMG016 TaxID=2822690 RepID=UPI001B39D5EC|nr:GLPGLI family protein [Aquimarina sp. MMG016]MBQ4818501.1 GLPGLI family protein [Aquimarina sp. MMG016]
MIRFMIVLMLFLIKSISAQDFQGVVTYKTNRKMDLKLEDSKMNADMQKQIQEMIKKQFQKEFTLTFNTSESIYKEEQTLEAPQQAIGGVRVMVAGSGTSDILYKNIKEERFSGKREMLGKVFLVKDQLEKLDWKLEDETKKIGNYTCYKATAKRMEQRVRSITIDNDKKEETPAEEEEITITAWYTPEIPVANGPGNYWGLPGLILEVNNGEQSMLCNKIVLNPKKKVEIIEPTKGKIVTQEKFEEIMQKKMKEMRDRMSHRGDGESVRIRIGG